MPEEPWTILKLLQWTTAYFKERNIDEPRASAEVLLAHVLCRDRLFLYLNYDLPMDRRELSAFRECIKRRVAGEPTQYITGTQEFWSLPLRVSPDVLIPRPETEVLVEAVVDYLRSHESTEANLRIMDLGTGSGAIAIALARELPGAVIVAVDLSMAALKLARENALRHQVQEHIHLVRGDILAGAVGEANSFGVVVSNPPYVSRVDFKRLPREIRDYEPRHALEGGEDGLAAISRIIKEAPAVLSPTGVLFLEFGAGQAARVSSLTVQSRAYKNHRILKDYSGIERILVAPRK